MPPTQNRRNKTKPVPPSAAEIEQEIAKLVAMKPTVRATSMFGDNHHDAIDAQVEVLTRRMAEPAIYARFGDPLDDDPDQPQNVVDSAIEAGLWLVGEGDGNPPSAEWQPLVR
jgi:hypothetical protein